MVFIEKECWMYRTRIGIVSLVGPTGGGGSGVEGKFDERWGSLDLAASCVQEIWRTPDMLSVSIINIYELVSGISPRKNSSLVPYTKLTVRMQPPLELENLLPFDIKYRVYDICRAAPISLRCINSAVE